MAGIEISPLLTSILCRSTTPGRARDIGRSSVQSRCSSMTEKHNALAGSGTLAQPLSKKQPHVEESLEQVSATGMPDVTVDKPAESARKRATPSGDATDGLAEDVRNAGSKKPKTVDSEQDRRIRLFHAAREAHNLDADRRIFCERLVEFIVDESFTRWEPDDRQELIERLLMMGMQEATLEDIMDADPFKIRTLQSYSKRMRAWDVICKRFPNLLAEFKAQSNGALPYDVLNENAFKRINEYMGELKAAMRPMPKMLKVLKEAVVWVLLGSAGRRYEHCDDGVRKCVFELIRKNTS